MNQILNIENLEKQYKNCEHNVLNKLNLVVNEGEIYGFLGPNGAGKTTIISILSGLLPFDKGEISILGHSIKKEPKEIKRKIGIVPQNIALFPTLTARENLIIMGGIFGIEKQELKKRITYWLNLFGLEQHQNRKIETYSGGMKRRINLIAGIIHNPQLLLLDEPTVGIDVQSKTVILENLKKINSKETTILYTSHDMDEAQQFCTKVGFIDNGKIITEGSPKELISNTQDCKNLESVYLKLTGKKLRD